MPRLFPILYHRNAPTRTSRGVRSPSSGVRATNGAPMRRADFAVVLDHATHIAPEAILSRFSPVFASHNLQPSGVNSSPSIS